MIFASIARDRRRPVEVTVPLLVSIGFASVTAARDSTAIRFDAATIREDGARARDRVRVVRRRGDGDVRARVVPRWNDGVSSAERARVGHREGWDHGRRGRGADRDGDAGRVREANRARGGRRRGSRRSIEGDEGRRGEAVGVVEARRD